jgi:hypothetical protein
VPHTATPEERQEVAGDRARQQPYVGSQEKEMNPRVLKLSLFAGLGLALGLVLSRSLPLSAAEEVSQSAPGTLVIVAGTGQPGFSGDNGPATEARLHIPTGLAVDALGHLYIADYENRRVRKVGVDGIISTVAGGGTALPTETGSPAIAVALGAVTGIAVDATGNLYLAERTLLGEDFIYGRDCI